MPNLREYPYPFVLLSPRVSRAVFDQDHRTVPSIKELEVHATQLNKLRTIRFEVYGRARGAFGMTHPDIRKAIEILRSKKVHAVTDSFQVVVRFRSGRKTEIIPIE